MQISKKNNVLNLSSNETELHIEISRVDGDLQVGIELDGNKESLENKLDEFLTNTNSKKEECVSDECLINDGKDPVIYITDERVKIENTNINKNINIFKNSNFQN